jgi:putative endonuclease
VKKYENGCYVYILTNEPNGILYIGVTSNLPKRMFEHRNGVFEGFSKQHELKRLVYCERYDLIEDAIAREKQLKKWKRAWKVRLILETNPLWEDLYEYLSQSF